MNTISYRKIREFVDLHPNSESSLGAWYKIAKKAKWQNIVEVRQDYPHADLVGACVIFNIGGNKYRLITKFEFLKKTVYIKFVLTHKEYDKAAWKKQC